MRKPRREISEGACSLRRFTGGAFIGRTPFKRKAAFFAISLPNPLCSGFELHGWLGNIFQPCENPAGGRPLSEHWPRPVSCPVRRGPVRLLPKTQPVRFLQKEPWYIIRKSRLTLVETLLSDHRETMEILTDLVKEIRNSLAYTDSEAPAKAEASSKSRLLSYGRLLLYYHIPYEE